jgi:hypothetical protein
MALLRAAPLTYQTQSSLFSGVGVVANACAIRCLRCRQLQRGQVAGTTVWQQLVASGAWPPPTVQVVSISNTGNRQFVHNPLRMCVQPVGPPDAKGSCTAEKGVLSYYEIKRLIGNAPVKYDDQRSAAYATCGPGCWVRCIMPSLLACRRATHPSLCVCLSVSVRVCVCAPIQPVQPSQLTRIAKCIRLSQRFQLAQPSTTPGGS